MKKIHYGNSVAIETSAAGVKGLLCKSLDGTFFFRITGADGGLQDYYIRHDDIPITISEDAFASFYKLPEREKWLLDHPSSVLGQDEA